MELPTWSATLLSYPRLTTAIFIADMFDTIAKASSIFFWYYFFANTNIFELERLEMSYLFSFLYHTCFMAWMIQVLLCYMVQVTFKDYSSNCANRDVANTALFFSKADHRKFVLTKRLFMPRPCFTCHLTAKNCAIFSWFHLQVIFSSRLLPQLKTKIWNYIVLYQF